MKIFPVLLIGLLVSTYGAICQSPISSPALHYHIAKVQLKTTNTVETGILFSLTDSMVILVPRRELKSELKRLNLSYGGTLPPTDSLTSILQLSSYRAADISKLTIHRPNAAVVGMLAGVAGGVVLTYAQPVDFVEEVLTLGNRGIVYTSRLMLYIPSFAMLCSVLGKSMSIKKIKAKQGLVYSDVQARFLKYTIVEQLNQARLYTQ